MNGPLPAELKFRENTALSQHFALSEKQVIMLAKGRGRWAVS